MEQWLQITTQAALWFSDNLTTVGTGSMGFFAFWQIRARSKHTKKAKKLLQKAISTGSAEPATLHPEIDPRKCISCGTCTRVCPEGEVIKFIHHKPVLVSPTKCVGHGECEKQCPQGAIKLVFGTKARGMDIPRISRDYETNLPGLYIAGELGGMGLIRNAIKQGYQAAYHALKGLPKSTNQVDTDLLVIGAGPAGLAAALTAITQKKRYICIEQNSFGGTVFNFPRQKIVMTHPAELPGAGLMKFKKNRVHKEELLAFWEGVRKDTGLKIQERVRFETIIKTEQGHFEVKTNQGVITAYKVILATGVRGSPRKLGLPNEDLPKVTYNLIDPEQYHSNDITVVGGGNAGVEAAIAMAKKELGNRVSLLVRGAAFDRCNEANQKLIEGLAAQGLVKIRYNTSVQAIEKDSITILEKDKTPEKIANDFLFVFAGAESPHKFLMNLGVKIDKKFGEGLGEAA